MRDHADTTRHSITGQPEFDDFERDWPNIIVADEATIKSIDEKWDQLGLGAFISSPSLAYSSQMYGNEAVVS